MNPEIIETNQMPYINPSELENGDEVFLQDGRLMRLIRKMNAEATTWIAEEITDLENFDMGKWLMDNAK